MSLRAFAVLLGAMLLAPLPLAAAAGEANDPGLGTYLVGIAPGQETLAEKAVGLADGRILSRITAIETLVVALPASAASALARNPAIAFVEPDRLTVASGAQWDGAQWDGAQWNGAQWNGAQWDGAQWNGAQWNGAQWDGTLDPGLVNGWQWGLSAIRAPEAWTTTPGSQRASLCVVDSGIDAGHRDLAKHVGRQYNAIDNTTNLTDTGGHGTHVAGIAAAVHGEGWGIAGVSNSTILSAKVLGANGTGSASALARGLTWCAERNADVVLMALSVQGTSTAVARALDLLAGKDIVMVASAGNGGCSNCVSYPARDARVIAVAASTPTGALASFSSTGPEVALRAPGVDILSTIPGNLHAYGSGTSQSAAITAGAALLLLEAKPTLSSAEVRSALVSAGGGKLDVQASLELVVPPPAVGVTAAVSETVTATTDGVAPTAG